MNKMFTFFTAPVAAFFYPPVYQDAAKSSAGRGVLYALYLACLPTVLIMILLSAKVAPQADAFVDWAKTSMPAMIWTSEGLSLENGQTTAVMEHPKYGPIVAFDMTKTDVTDADMGKAFLLVTAKRVFIRKAPGQIEERDITGAGMHTGQQLPPRVRIDGAIAMKLYQNLKNAIAFIAPFLILVFCFVFFLILDLFYSLAGLLFNAMRTEKLHYGAIFNLTCFATTPTLVLSWLKALTPLRSLPWPFFMNILINLIYLFLAFKITDKKSETV